MSEAATIRFLEPSAFERSRSYSPAVLATGGTTVYLAGQTAITDLEGKPIPGDFDAQVKTVFAQMDAVLKRAGGSLANVVTMTVYIKDPRHGDRFKALRSERFGGGDLPASALLTIAHFAHPDMMIEIQGIGVI